MKVFHRLLKDSFVYGGADLFSKIIAFIAFPIIAAILSPKVFGALELIMTTTALLSLVLGCGLNNSVQRYYWDRETQAWQRPLIVSSGLAAQLLFGIGGVAIMLLVLPAFLAATQSAKLPFTWIALVAALLLMVSRLWLQYFLDVVRLHLAPLKFFALSVVSRALGILLSVLSVVYWNWGIDGLLGVQAVVGLSVLPLAMWMVRSDLTLKVDIVWIRELVRYGFPFIFTGLAYWVFGYTDRWLLAAMSSVEEVGIYSVSFRFSSIVLFISAAFGQAWSPIAIKIQADNPKGYREVYARALLLLLFVMLIVGGGVALFSGELIGLLMPDEYKASALPLAILSIGIVLQSTQQITAIGISLEKKTIIFTQLAWVTALINIVLNMLLIPAFGAVGAAWATTGSYLVLTASYLYWTQELHPLPIQWVKLGSLLSLGTLVAAAAVFFNHTLFSWKIAAGKLLFSLVCAFLGWITLSIREPRLER